MIDVDTVEPVKADTVIADAVTADAVIADSEKKDCADIPYIISSVALGVISSVSLGVMTSFDLVPRKYGVLKDGSTLEADGLK